MPAYITTTSTDPAWRNWVVDVNFTATSATANTVWYGWCQQGTVNALTAANGTVDTAWKRWIGTSNVTSPAIDYAWYNWVEQDDELLVQKERTAEEEAKRQELLAERQRQREEEHARLQAEQEERNRLHAIEVKALKKKQKEAEERAQRLLLENLSLKQRLSFEQNKHFEVEGRSGKIYKIRLGRAKNIEVYDKDRKYLHTLCIHPSMPVPDHDTVLAQKLGIECNEEEFLRMANVHNIPQQLAGRA